MIRSTLPAQLTSLIDREREFALGKTLLLNRKVRLLTLTGPPGTGKSRLAIVLGAAVAHRIPDGVWFVPLARAGAVLDIGTGDGRRFARYAPFPSVAVAAEGFAPKVPLAWQRLEPMGVQVVWTDENCNNSRRPQPGNRWPQRRLPFANDTFDLVLASRAAFAPREVARILRSGGTVLTLQGITEWRVETIADALTGTPPDWTLPGFGWDVGDSFRHAGLDILDWTEYSVAVTYHDIGGVVYELLYVPWSVVDFDLSRYRERLFRLHRRMQAEDGFRTRVHTNLIEAEKP